METTFNTDKFSMLPFNYDLKEHIVVTVNISVTTHEFRYILYLKVEINGLYMSSCGNEKIENTCVVWSDVEVLEEVQKSQGFIISRL